MFILNLTEAEEKRYRLAWNLARYDFICGTGKVRNESVARHYRNICNEILIAARQR